MVGNRPSDHSGFTSIDSGSMLLRGSSSEAEAAEEKTADASVSASNSSGAEAEAEGSDQRSLGLRPLIMGRSLRRPESIMASKLGGSGSGRTADSAPLGRSEL